MEAEVAEIEVAEAEVAEAAYFFVPIRRHLTSSCSLGLNPSVVIHQFCTSCMVDFQLVDLQRPFQASLKRKQHSDLENKTGNILGSLASLQLSCMQLASRSHTWDFM